MNKKTYNQFLEAEKYLEALGRLSDKDFAADPAGRLKRTKRLLAIAGRPDRELKIIHIAGTSGKGSVVSNICNILRAVGHRVGAHFSPFVSAPSEKIQINNKFISATEFIRLVEQIKPIVKKCAETLSAPNYFEIWVLMALIYFKKKKCDYVVLETGCGGRFDATNAVGKTLASVITNIGFDHTHILGKTIAKIAYEKAGIVRKKGIVFTAAERPSALKVIKSVCHAQNASLKIVRAVSDVNRELATAIAKHLGINERALVQGTKNIKLPARFEIMQKNPLVILDGAHNPDKLKHLYEAYSAIYCEAPPKKVHLICALTTRKSVKGCFQKIIKLADYLYCTRPETAARDFVDPRTLAKKLRGLKKIPARAFLRPQEALDYALKKAGKNDLILITGSFYLCGDLRRNWISEKAQIDERTNFPRRAA